MLIIGVILGILAVVVALALVFAGAVGSRWESAERGDEMRYYGDKK